MVDGSDTTSGSGRKADDRCLTKKVNVSRVNMPVIKRWITKTLHKELPDDDVAVEFIYELLIGAEDYEPDVGAIREQMDDFLGEKKSCDFCVQLWSLLLDAQDSRDGVPQQLVEERKAKIEREEKDAKARRETELILGQLRPKASLDRSRNERRVSDRPAQKIHPNTDRRGDRRGERRIDRRLDHRGVGQELDSKVTKSVSSSKPVEPSEPSEFTTKPETMGHRVGKPPRKTNYNRS